MNKEMDLLLRRLSRRQDGAMSNGDASIVGEHLDADELSSYAENALPAAARTRYTEHLAECASCRELIVQLSSSAGVLGTEKTADVPAPPGLRNFLASLFSPMVLRYAIPALGLIVVAAIGLFSLRQERRSELSQVSAPAPVSNVNAYTYSLPDDQRGFNSANNSASPTTETDSVRQDKSSQRDEIPPPPNAPPLVDLRAEVSKDAETKKAEDQQTAASAAPGPQPTPAPSVGTEEAKKFAYEPPKEVSRRAVNELPASRTEGVSDLSKAKDRREGEKADSGAREERSTNAGRSTRGREPAAAPATTLQAQSERNQRDGVDDSDNAEIRSVAGRRFRKQDNSWIDVAYRSGTSTVNVSRGSEQFRALIADEPEIKTIADQLNGEIIVVWKSRAYRIR